MAIIVIILSLFYKIVVGGFVDHRWTSSGKVDDWNCTDAGRGSWRWNDVCHHTR